MVDNPSDKIDLIVQRDKPLFNPKKHYLGTLCCRGHAYENTGQSWRNINHGNCVQCTRERALSWKKENIERAKASTRRRDKDRRKDPENSRRRKWPIANHLMSMRLRCRQKNIALTIDADYLRDLWARQDGKCYWTGVPMDFHIGGHRHAFRPSVDRIDPANGYVPGNVVWTTNFANRARGDLGVEEFKLALSAVVAAMAARDGG